MLASGLAYLSDSMTYAYCDVNSIMRLSFIAHFLLLTSSLKPFNFIGLSLHLHPLSWATFLILLKVRRSMLQSLSCSSCGHLFQCTYLFQSMVILIFIEMSLLVWLARRSYCVCPMVISFTVIFCPWSSWDLWFIETSLLGRRYLLHLYQGHLFHCTFMSIVPWYLWFIETSILGWNGGVHCICFHESL